MSGNPKLGRGRINEGRGKAFFKSVKRSVVKGCRLAMSEIEQAGKGREGVCLFNNLGVLKFRPATQADN